MGSVGRFVSADSSVYDRDSKVVCRTNRGLEWGQVICEVSSPDSVTVVESDGAILRPVTPDDQLIIERLDRHRDKAFVACENLLQERGLSQVLVDVEHLFDGESVYFYFLGQPDPSLDQVTDELAETYDRKVRFKKFAESLAEGCGPDCGTKDGGCSSSGCGSCKLSGKCGSK
jgi:cell fate regulator YaaT (PSP1 superfamily)